jgi:N-hydroxyarylamine O-acetyltransferase
VSAGSEEEHENREPLHRAIVAESAAVGGGRDTILKMRLDRYLDRIGYRGSRAATAETLRRLHTLHLSTVPFENLDVGRRPIVVDEAAFVRKIVEQRRGGFCYELNGAFASLLRAVGFEVTLLSAGVAREAGGFGPEFDHLALLVTADRSPWLADVGFGDSFLEPLRFEPDREQQDPAGAFRIASGDAGTFVLERRQNDVWEGQYRFTLTPRDLADFAGMCDYHQSSPHSSFTQKTVCSRATGEGRITLSAFRLITTRDGVREEHEVAGESEWLELLREHFGIVLPA